MRLLAFFEYTLVIVGAIGMVASRFFFLPKGFHLGLFLVGAGVALGGLESLIWRRMSFRFATHGGERHAGAPAVIWGAMALLIGLVVIGAAYLMEAGLWRTTVNRLMRHPGPVIAACGLLVMGMGMLLMFNRGRGGVWRTVLVRVPKALLGLALIVAGVVAVALGVVEWFDPNLYARQLRQASAYVDLRGIERALRALMSRLI